MAILPVPPILLVVRRQARQSSRICVGGFFLYACRSSAELIYQYRRCERYKRQDASKDHKRRKTYLPLLYLFQDEGADDGSR